VYLIVLATSIQNPIQGFQPRKINYVLNPTQFYKHHTSLSRVSTVLSASTRQIDQTADKNADLPIPTVKELINFGLPTLGIWLLQPILSLIDTSVVGMSSHAASAVIELAALGPGIAWIDSSAYMCQFIGMATTNLYASAISEGDVAKQKKVLNHALIISFGFGVMLFVAQTLLAKRFITLLAGSALASIPYALQYARIRAIGSIAAIPTIVGQAAFLARKDSITPLKAVFVGAVVNIVGDVLLVSYMKKGIAGAAWATMLSQVSSALYLIYASLKSSKSKARTISTSKSTSSSVDSTKTLEDDSFHKEDGKSQSLFSGITSMDFPNFADLLKFVSFCGPLFFILLTKSFVWSYTTYACSSAGAVSLAAHQVCGCLLYPVFPIRTSVR
jgi:Na+-driven multidrug efflux pump